jgi:hypothetical protein
MKKQLIVLLLLTLVALASIYFTTFRGMPEPDRQPYKELGKKMADETAKLLGNQGRIAIIINREFGAFPIPYLDVEMKVFMDALKQKGIMVAGIERVEMEKVGLARPDAFLAAVENQKSVGAIVSVVGFPLGPNRQPGDFRNYRARFIVVAPYEPGLRRLLQEDIIQIAILPRFASPTTNGSRQAPQTFDGGFEIFTSRDASRLP